MGKKRNKRKLGMGNDPSETPKKKKKKNNGMITSGGFIFMCNGRTKPECFRHRVFGVPFSQGHLVQHIKAGSTLFLFDFEVKLLYGAYRATSSPQLHLQPHAFGGNIQFDILKECLPLPLPHHAFRPALSPGSNSKFKQDLTIPQVHHLMSLFAPLHPPAPLGSSPSIQYPNPNLQHHPYFPMSSQENAPSEGPSYHSYH